MLKKFQLFGFKSFAKRTSLSFGPGITAIVGPNGCGKSNLVDAFKWVLGEQSAKSLRGGKMPDVIFSGTETAKALNIAEVSLTISNASGLFPIPFEELEVTRRLTRGGDSDYFLNSKPVRLKEINALFCDSGIGKSAFSIFEQGKVDQIIHQSPLERRLIIEEAAEITRFLQRKKEAVQRLEKSEENILRAEDIAGEVAAQLQALKVQSEKALFHKEKKGHLDLLEKQLYLAKWQALKQKKDKCALDYVDREAKLKCKQEEIVAVQERLKKLQEDLVLNVSALTKLKEEEFRKRVQKEALLSQKSSMNQRIQETESLKRRREEEAQTLDKIREKQEEEISSKRQRCAELALVLKEKEACFSKEKETVKSLQGQMNEYRSLFDQHQAEHLILVKQLHKEEAKLKEEQFKKKSWLTKHALLEEKLKSSLKKQGEIAEQIEKKQEEKGTLLLDIQEKRDVFEAVSKELELIEKSIEKQRTKWEEHQHIITESTGRKKSLQKLKMENVGLTKGTTALLKKFNELKPLFECLEGLSKKEESLLGALFPYSQVLVAPSKELFNEAHQYACEKKLQSVALYFSNAASLEKHFFQNVTERDLGWEDEKGVLFINWKNEGSVFSRHFELKELERKIEEYQSKLKQEEEILQNLKKKRAAQLEEKAIQDGLLRKKEMTLIEVNFFLQRGCQEKEHLEKQIKTSKEEIEVTLKWIIQVEEEIQKASLVCKHVQDSISKEGEFIESKKKKLEEIKRLHLESAQLTDRLEKAWKTLFLEEKGIQEAIYQLVVKEEEAKAKKAWLDQEMLSLGVLKSDLLTKLKNLEKEGEGQSKLQEESLKAIDIQEKFLQSKRMEEKEILSLMHEKNKEKEKTAASLKAVEITQIELQAKMELLAQEANKRFSITLAEQLGKVLLVEEKIEKEIEEIKEVLNSAGEINFAAIEEFKEKSERHQFLREQLDDLCTSKNELLRLIEELTEESQSKFKLCFDKVRKSFKKNFTILFEGGEADLQLLENDSSEPGIEILAQPPGKKMRSLQLLSGGEKCLTAMALLFALFEVKPAPFCLLDEMDAPLDDANIDRFLKMLKAFSDRCQFLIITHNKKTMRAADRLFGLTMQEKGVSSLLSLNFSKESEQKESALAAHSSS